MSVSHLCFFYHNHRQRDGFPHIHAYHFPADKRSHGGADKRKAWLLMHRLFD